MISLMRWPPEDSQCYAWLPEPGTAAEWTEGGFETIFRTYDETTPGNVNTRSGVSILGGEPFNIRGKRLVGLL